MIRPREAILDGDIIAYRAAFWADSEGIDGLEQRIIKDVKDWTPAGCNTVYIAMSCPRSKNYRRMFWPSYKMHREDKPKPECMQYAIETIYNVAGTMSRCVDCLEADDLMGMLASSGMAISVTVDKDLRQIPGWHWNPDKENDAVEVTQEEGDNFFYQQWMTGDTTDNIWGLWKVGPAKAKKFLDATPREEWDQKILDLYLAEDWTKRPEDKVPVMTPQEFAIAQARSVRILRDGDFNKDNRKITLWCPNNLTVRNILNLDTGELDE